MMKFKALRVSALSEEVAVSLETVLDDLPGVEHLKIALETQELDIVFDENRLGFQALVREMAKAGCSLRHIDAALLVSVQAPPLSEA